MRVWSFILAVILLVPSALTAQRPTSRARTPATAERKESGPYARYAHAIIATLDSAVSEYPRLQIQIVRSGLRNPATAVIAQESTKRIAGLVSDFEVTAPPAGFERLHQQFIDSLHVYVRMMGDRTRILRIMAGSEADANAGLEFMQSLVSLPELLSQVLASRDRAETMLAEHGVRLTAYRKRDCGGASIEGAFDSRACLTRPSPRPAREDRPTDAP